MRKLGMNLSAIQELDRETEIAELKNAGFDATFAYYYRHSDADQIRRTAELLARVGLVFDTIHAPFWAVNTIWRDTPDTEPYLGDLRDSIRLASECGVSTVVLHLSSGDRPPLVNDKGAERIDGLVSLAKEKHITLAFENQRKISNIAYVMERYEDEPTVGFCWDVGHEKCLSGGWEYMPMFAKRLCALHIHDNPCRHNADFHMIPGDGSMKYTRMAECIRTSGYEGTLMLELFQNPSGNYDKMTPREYFHRAYDAADRLRRLTDGQD